MQRMSAAPKLKVATPQSRRIGDAALQARTGRDWAAWIALLNSAGAAARTHREIVALLADGHDVAGWWAQMIAVGYEQALGRRKLNEKPTGFEISVSKTLACGTVRAFSAFATPAARARWLKGGTLDVHRKTPPRSLRASWTDGRKSISVNFYPKSAQRTQVTLQHAQLRDARTAARMKTFWRARLESLNELLGATRAQHEQRSKTQR